MISPHSTSFFFFFNDTATTEIYTLSLHDALPISLGQAEGGHSALKVDDLSRRTEHRDVEPCARLIAARVGRQDRKSTRLNSSHLVISYAVFCLKKKKTTIRH